MGIGLRDRTPDPGIPLKLADRLSRRTAFGGGAFRTAALRPQGDRRKMLTRVAASDELRQTIGLPEIVPPGVVPLLAF